MMAKLTEVLMWWEKVPYTPAASKIMKGWVHEVAEDADSNVGSPDHFFREHLAYPDDFVGILKQRISPMLRKFVLPPPHFGKIGVGDRSR
jgi:hypothetical protein